MQCLGILLVCGEGWICFFAHLVLTFQNLGGGSEISNLKQAWICFFAHLALTLSANWSSMRNLIQFLWKYSVFFLFLLLEIGSFSLYLHHHHYPQTIFLSSANGVTSRTLNISNEVKQFIHLRSVNAFLSEENVKLNNRLTELESALMDVRRSYADSIILRPQGQSQIRYLSARIVNASTNRTRNYLTLNRGSEDGIRPDMGVVSGTQVVGIVKSVSEHFCVVLPLIHPSIGISCKLKSNNYVGVLRWEPGDASFGLLDDVARHVDVSRGDSIVTSGYTSIFPEGFYVGKVSDYHLEEGAPYYRILVDLGVDYHTLSHVEIVDNDYYEEQRDLEIESEKE